jgi:ribonuclease HI
MRYVLDNNILECQIFSDSSYVVSGLNEWIEKWVERNWVGSSGHQIKNIELWQDTLIFWDRSRSLSNISIHHVKGHSTNKWNNYVDKLAVKASKMNDEDREE